MRQDSFRVFAKYYDQIYLKRNDYKREAEAILNVIKRFEKKPSRTLLDVGCGTGEHLKYLSQDFRCKGIDINEGMIATARNKVPDAKFEIANMTSFSLKEKFDVITCLFSSIGYVQNTASLVRTLRNFYRHLNDRGLVVIEPWVFRSDFRKGNVAIDTYEDDKIKLARMGTSKLTRSRWLVHFHYLIGIDGEIKHVHEIHKMLAADYEDYVRAFDLVGYSETRFLKESFWMRSRGLFLATK